MLVAACFWRQSQKIEKSFFSTKSNIFKPKIAVFLQKVKILIFASFLKYLKVMSKCRKYMVGSAFESLGFNFLRKT